MLLISSMMITVLPTPAPPNSPILPPLAYGVRRSTTLIPVTRISASVDWSMNSGAGLWIGDRRLVCTGPRSSTGSPTTWRMRPRVSGPTGIVIGPPVSATRVPRTSPSVLSIATVRTVFSPSCWATSRTSVWPLWSTCSAVRISGSSPSKRTSTTAPMIWVIVPMLFLGMFSELPLWTSQRLGAGDDLDQLLSDGGLAGAVVVEGKAVDHLACIAGCIVHRRHPRPLLARGVFEQCRIDLHREVLRQQVCEDLLLRGLEFVNRAADRRHCLLAGRRLERDQLLRSYDLGHRRAETVVDDRRDIEMARLIEDENALGDVARLVEGYLAAAYLGQAVTDQPAVVTAQSVAALAPYGQNHHGLAGREQLADAAS